MHPDNCSASTLHDIDLCADVCIGTILSEMLGQIWLAQNSAERPSVARAIWTCAEAATMHGTPEICITSDAATARTTTVRALPVR